jgi:hypothetical protein
VACQPNPCRTKGTDLRINSVPLLENHDHTLRELAIAADAERITYSYRGSFEQGLVCDQGEIVIDPNHEAAFE